MYVNNRKQMLQNIIISRGFDRPPTESNVIIINILWYKTGLFRSGYHTLFLRGYNRRRL